MKKFVLSLTLALFAGTLAAQIRMVRLTRFEGKPITGISASSSFDVELIRSERTSAIVEINTELEKYLVFELDAQGVLKLGLRPGGIRTERSILRARICLNDLRFISASGASDISCTGSFEGKDASIRLSGASELDALDLTCTGDVDISCSGASNMDGTSIRFAEMKITLSGASDATISGQGGRLNCELSGASKLRISGEADDAMLRLSGASDFSGPDLVVKDARIEATSASKVDFGEVEGELTARGSGASKITYRGNPSSGGSLSASSASSIRKVQ